MIHTIRVLSKNNVFQTTPKIVTAKIYRIEGINDKQSKILAEQLFCEKINQEYTLDKPIIRNASVVIEISYKPGVMNPEVASIIKSANDLNIYPTAADSSYEYGFYGKTTKEKAYEIIKTLGLFNKTVEYIVEIAPKTLLIEGALGKTTIVPIRKMGDEELLSLSKDKLFLNLEEMKIIQKYFIKIKRDPKDIELETIAQTWSEHCAHKTFKAKLIVDGQYKKPLIERIKKEALKHKKNILSAFVDNSGVMDFYDKMAICGKVETHNSPSAIEPYGGAATGSGGVFRDILGTGRGAKTIASTDIFCFAKPDMNLSKLPVGCLPPKYLLKRVVDGVRDYGNRMGIPTNNGSVHFHDDFRAKPTIIVGAYGIIPAKNSQKGKAKKGDILVAIGGKTGRDGIHGATFSSAEMTDRTINVNSQAVQIGNAIEEKRMSDALIEASGKDIIRAIQDCGAGGFSSAIGEMGEDIGVKVDLSLAPLKYQGLSPWEIWVSESQERMVLAISKNNLNEFIKICQKYNVETTKLGVFDGSKKLKLYYGKKAVADLDMKFLHHGLPQRLMIARKSNKKKEIGSKKLYPPKSKKEWIEIVKKVLSHENICSKEPIVRLYDHSVQGTNALQPFNGEKLDGPNDAVILRPILDKSYGMVISHGLNPILNRIDSYWGSIWAGVEAVSNYVAVGGDYKNACLINNYIWPFPDEESLWSLDKSVDAVVNFMKVLKIPVISGKDSLSSTYKGKNGTVIKIPPVLCMSIFGKIKDVGKTCSADFKKSNSILILVGKMDYGNLGGSIYYDTQNIVGDNVPKIDLKELPRTLNIIYNAIQKKQILSCHDISEGGLITAIFEMCVGGNIGADIDIGKIKNTRDDYILFNETTGCFIVEVESKDIAENLFKSIPYVILGTTQKGNSLTVKNKNKTLFSVKAEELKKVWQEPMKKIFN